MSKSIENVLEWRKNVPRADHFEHKNSFEPINNRFDKNLQTNKIQNHMYNIQRIKPIELKVFSGNKEKYEEFISSFKAVVDSGNYDRTYKLLQLRQYLTGEALQCIESLGYSETAYQVALEKLNRKYGGERRQTALIMEKVEKYKTLKENNPTDFENFCDFLDSLIVNLKDSNRDNELGSGLLYRKLQTKLPPTFLAKYYRWLYENDLLENVFNLRKHVLQESEFLKMAL